MRDLKSDWKRWNRAERISAVALVAFLIICGSFVFGALAGDSAPKAVFLQGITTVERSTSHGSDRTR